MQTLFVTVAGRDLSPLGRYLYDGVTVLELFPNGRTQTAILKVQSEEPGVAQGIAQYQADRLASGLFGATVFEDFDPALAFLRETYGVFS